MIIEFRLDLVTGIALPVAVLFRRISRISIAALDHEAFDDAVKDSPVVKTLTRQLLKLSIVFGAASVQNCTTISPSLVLITATSLDEFMGALSSFFSSAASTAIPNKIGTKIENFIFFCSGGL